MVISPAQIGVVVVLDDSALLVIVHGVLMRSLSATQRDSSTGIWIADSICVRVVASQDR
jgi:hypothetical protein